MFLKLNKIILLITISLLLSFPSFGNDKNIYLGAGLETRGAMSGLTLDFNYKRFKTGVFLNYWHHMDTEKIYSAEAFLAFELYQGETYSFYLKAIYGKELDSESILSNRGAGLKNEWQFGPGSISLDLDMFSIWEYKRLIHKYVDGTEEDMGMKYYFKATKVMAKLGYIFYF